VDDGGDGRRVGDRGGGGVRAAARVTVRWCRGDPPSPARLTSGVIPSPAIALSGPDGSPLRAASCP
jgi:hypothetical protein